MKSMMLRDFRSPRHGLSTKQWKRIAHHFANTSKRGAPRRIPRRHILHAILWLDKVGTPWRDLDPRFPNWKTVHHYFRKWCKSGLLKTVFLELLQDKQQSQRIDHSQWNVDSTTIRAHRCAAGAQEGEPTLGRSRGGFGTKVHVLTSGCGQVLAFWITCGQRHETRAFIPLLNKVWLQDPETGLKVKPQKLAGDKAYSVRYFRRILRQRGIEPVFPAKRKRSGKVRGRPIKFDRESYRRRSMVEQVIGWLKEFRRVAFRFDRRTNSFEGMIYGALIKTLLASQFSDER